MTDWQATALEEKYGVMVIDSECPGDLRYIRDNAGKNLAISSGKVKGDMILLNKKQLLAVCQELPQILREMGLAV